MSMQPNLGSYCASVASRQLADKPGCCPCCGQSFTFTDLTVSLDANSVSYGEQTIYLWATAIEIISVLVECMPRIVPKELMFERVWGGLSEVDPKCIDVHLCRLRKKIAPLPFMIETIHGVGWRLKKK